MFLPNVWVTAAVAYNREHDWVSWTFLVIGLLVTGWIAYDAEYDKTDWLTVIVGMIVSFVLFLVWPILFIIIPIILLLGVMLGVVMLPRLVLTFRKKI